MKKGILLAGALLGTILLLALALNRLNRLVEPAMEPSAIQRTGPLVLDAGHGGEDGGAVSLTGVPESQINLAIVLKLRDILGFCGVDPILLRDEDISLYDEGAGTLREKKRSDLKNRVERIEAVKGGTLLSIHQTPTLAAVIMVHTSFTHPLKAHNRWRNTFRTALKLPSSLAMSGL